MARPLTLTPAALRMVGRLLDDTPSVLSPMYDPHPEDSPGFLEELRYAGVVDGSGSASGPHLATLTALANPYSFAQVVVYEAMAAEHAVFFTASDRRPITLTATDDGLLIRDPGPNRRIADGLAQLFGLSVIGGSDFTATTTAAEALVLAAILDEFRRMMLANLATGADITPVAAPTVRDLLQRGDDNPQRLLTAVKSQITNPPDLDAIDLDIALATLTDLGWLEHDSSAMVLAGAAKDTLPQMLLLRRGVRVTAGRDSGDGVGFVDFVGLSFGMHDILEIEETDGTVSFDFVSSAEFVGDVGQLLLDPDALRPSAEPDSSDEPGPDEPGHGGWLEPIDETPPGRELPPVDEAPPGGWLEPVDEPPPIDEPPPGGAATPGDELTTR